MEENPPEEIVDPLKRDDQGEHPEPDLDVEGSFDQVENADLEVGEEVDGDVDVTGLPIEEEEDR